MKKFLLFVMVIAIFLAGLYTWTRQRRVSPKGTPFTPASAPVLDMENVHMLAAIDQENTTVVEKVLPSVVSIGTSKQVRTNEIDLNQFLQGHGLVPKLENLSGLGSGVIVSKEGHILTNYHVVADTDTIQVELNDGRVEPAKIIGTDPDTDIAVLQIKADNLTPLLLGNSDEVKVGQVVFAVGNPLGLQETVTHGIISAKSRVVDETSLEYFQTDAAINEGNSGGPLVDLRGEVIGINSRVASQAGNHPQPQGLSFAIPSNVARHTMESILKYGHVEHSYLGVKFPQEFAQPGLSPTNGVMVTGIQPGSPAEKAGLKSGDVITKYNGHEITGARDLRNRVAETAVDSKVPLVVTRSNGETTTLTAQITARPSDTAETQPAAGNILSGIKVSEISTPRPPEIPAQLKGVIVTEIDPDSAIGKIPGSLKPGDVIEEIDHLPVASVADFDQIAKQLPPDAVQTLFLVFRGGAHAYIVVTQH